MSFVVLSAVCQILTGTEGVGRSTPQAQRFPSQLASALWGEISLATLLPALSIPGNIGLTIAKGEVTNAVYEQTGAAYLPHINTPNTATDMLQIMQAFGQDKLTYYGISCVILLALDGVC